MKILLSCLIILLVGLLGAVRAEEQLVVYDHFPQGFLDETKWGGNQTIAGATILEYVREIQGGRLHMGNRAFGNQSSNFWRSTAIIRTSSLGLPGELITARASIKVEGAEVTGCSDNEAPTEVRATLVGDFFKTSSDLPDGPKDHVIGTIQILRSSNSGDKENVLVVRGVIVRCLDNQCLSSDLIFKELGNVKLGQWATVQIEWDQVGEGFIFTLDKKPPQFVSYSEKKWIVYPLNCQPQCQGISLEANIKIANCVAGRQMGFVDADFDNVFINEGAIP